MIHVVKHYGAKPDPIHVRHFASYREASRYMQTFPTLHGEYHRAMSTVEDVDDLEVPFRLTVAEARALLGYMGDQVFSPTDLITAKRKLADLVGKYESEDL